MRPLTRSRSSATAEPPSTQGDEDGEADPAEAAALVANIKDTAKKLIALVPELPREAAAAPASSPEPGSAAAVGLLSVGAIGRGLYIVCSV